MDFSSPDGRPFGTEIEENWLCIPGSDPDSKEETFADLNQNSSEDQT